MRSTCYENTFCYNIAATVYFTRLVVTATYELWVFIYGNGSKNGCQEIGMTLHVVLGFPSKVVAYSFRWFTRVRCRVLLHLVVVSSCSITVYNLHINTYQAIETTWCCSFTFMIFCCFITSLPLWSCIPTNYPILHPVEFGFDKYAVQNITQIRSPQLKLTGKRCFSTCGDGFGSWWSWRAISCNRNQPWLKRLTNGDTIYRGKFTIKNMQPCQHRSWTS